jgi:hypothetical protein
MGVGCLLTSVGSTSLSATEAEVPPFAAEQMRIRYNLTDLAVGVQSGRTLSFDMGQEEAPLADSRARLKSPAKAFLLSLVVPGLGQYYYGSKVKPVLFLGAEVAAWVLYFKWHGDGEDITADYEAFNRAHWFRDRYEQEYLLWAFDVTDDEDLPVGTLGISHNLPDTRTQQYYEMTGKYDQFAWGWDDAILNGEMLGPGVEPIIGDATTPYSANRFYYESLRNDANNAFDKATRMVFVSMANHLASAFEALLTTKRINRKAQPGSDVFSRLEVKARLRSLYTRRDTPYIAFAYKF